jgi:hypothetical protein
VLRNIMWLLSHIGVSFNATSHQRSGTPLAKALFIKTLAIANVFKAVNGSALQRQASLSTNSIRTRCLGPGSYIYT